MNAYTIVLTTQHRQRLRGVCIAATRVQACRIGWRCAQADGHTPVSIHATPRKRTA